MATPPQPDISRCAVVFPFLAGDCNFTFQLQISCAISHGIMDQRSSLDELPLYRKSGRPNGDLVYYIKYFIVISNMSGTLMKRDKHSRRTSEHANRDIPAVRFWNDIDRDSFESALNGNDK